MCIGVFHIAVLKKKYLDMILNGSKTVEVRLLKTRRPPYGVVCIDDIVLLKESGGLVLGHARVADVRYYAKQDGVDFAQILKRYSDCIGGDITDYLKSKQDSKYMALIFLSDIKRYRKGIGIEKKDRRSWVVVGWLLDGKNVKKIG